MDRSDATTTTGGPPARNPAPGPPSLADADAFALHPVGQPEPLTGPADPPPAPAGAPDAGGPGTTTTATTTTATTTTATTTTATSTAGAPTTPTLSAMDGDPQRRIGAEDAGGDHPAEPALPDGRRGPAPGPPGGLRAADPDNPRRRDGASAASVLAVVVISLVLAAVVNSASMLERAEARPLGPGRDLAVAIWRPVNQFSEAVGLTAPRRVLDAVRDRITGPEPGGLVVAAAPVPDAVAASTTSTGLSDLARAGLDGSVATGTASGPEGATPPLRSDSVSPATPPPGNLPSSTVPVVTLPSAAPAPAPLAPTTAPVATPTPTTSAAPATPTAGPGAGGSPLRRPTPADPLRVLVVGDSTMDALGPSILRGLAETGVTDATLDFRVSSGLSRPDFFDWPAHLASVRAGAGTEVVVLMLGANDAQPFFVDGEPEPFGTDRWVAAYRARVAALLEQLTADGGAVVWIGLPAMRRESYDNDMQLLTTIHAEEVARFPRALFVESRSVLADEDGEFTAFLVDDAGNRQRVRRDDGVHLTDAGGDRLAPPVIDAINRLAPLY